MKLRIIKNFIWASERDIFPQFFIEVQCIKKNVLISSLKPVTNREEKSLRHVAMVTNF